jgi:hypothetical protein
MWRYLEERSSGALDAFNERATPEDRANPLFGVVIAPYFIEALARHVTTQFDLTPEQSKDLASLHDERDKQEQVISTTLRFKSVRAAAVAVAAVLATQIPKESFEVLGLSTHAYGVYRLALFGLLAWCCSTSRSRH